MRSALRFCLTSLLLISLSACVSILDAVKDKPIEPDAGKRSFGAYVDDERMETVIAVNLRKAGPGLEDSHIDVKVFNAVVLLTGEVPSKELKQLAGQTAREVPGIRQVHNELLIKANSTFFSRTNDGWIATKVRTKLLARRDIEAERVKVVVENRIVYLMGLLTREEAQAVSEMAAKVSGVEKVVRVIEYIEER